MDDCRDCMPATLITELKEQFNDYKRLTEERFTEQGKRIGEIEVKNGAYEANYDNLMSLLGKIEKAVSDMSDNFKGSIEKLADKIEALEKEPAEKWKTIIMEILKTAVNWGTVGILGYLALRK